MCQNKRSVNLMCNFNKGLQELVKPENSPLPGKIYLTVKQLFKICKQLYYCSNNNMLKH